MAPTDASTDAGVPTATGTGPGAGVETGSVTGTETGTGMEHGAGTDTDNQDTLDLRLPDELVALFTEASGTEASGTGAPETEAPETEACKGEASEGDEAEGAAGGAGATANGAVAPAPPAASGSPLAKARADGHAGAHPHTDGQTDTSPMADRMPVDLAALADDDLLDNLAEWGPTGTPAGVFQLVRVRIERDLPLISRWMNDPAVAAFWELDGPETVTEAHLRPQLEGDGRSVPCLGVLDGAPVSYWEIYRADLDPVARYYPARPHDTGIHLLIGGVAHRGRGLGTTLLRAVADFVLDHRPRCTRVIAEPDLRNTPSISAFLSAGFRFSAEVELPGKRAALMVRDRVLRDLLHPGHS